MSEQEQAGSLAIAQALGRLVAIPLGALPFAMFFGGFFLFFFVFFCWSVLLLLLGVLILGPKRSRRLGFSPFVFLVLPPCHLLFCTSSLRTLVKLISVFWGLLFPVL
jgi:hypothetical protein